MMVWPTMRGPDWGGPQYLRGDGGRNGFARAMLQFSFHVQRATSHCRVGVVLCRADLQHKQVQSKGVVCSSVCDMTAEPLLGTG
jgi:hypothetical protein